MTTTALDAKKKLALSIIDFLQTSLKDGTLQEDESESIEVASSCIADAFHVDASNLAHMKEATGQQNLLQIYSVYDKLRQSSARPAASPGVSGASKSNPAIGSPNDESEALKKQGNAAMARKEHTQAIEFYTKAIAIAPTNPIYLSNRAAAYSASNKHTEAAADAELAVVSDPSYSKAWSRLGLAKFVLGDVRASMEAYKKGIEAEEKSATSSGPSESMKRGYETAKKRVEELEKAGGSADLRDDADIDNASGTSRSGGAAGMPDLSALAGMFGGGGGAGGAPGAGGGMPDLSSIMSNPMFRGMAENMMKNPEQLQGLMNNPQIKSMAESFGLGGAGGPASGSGAAPGGRGGGMPDLASLMSDPRLQDLAKNMMGGNNAGAGRGA